MKKNPKKIKRYLSNTNDNSIEIIEYNTEIVKESKVKISKNLNFSSMSEIPGGTTRWINIDGKCNKEILDGFSEIFNIHPLVKEDILDNNQRAKIEDYGDYLYIVAKMIYFSNDELIFEHISFILGKNYVLSFGETKGDVFDNIRGRIRNKGTQTRRTGADYLMYSLLDAIVDSYFSVLEVLGEQIDNIEEKVMNGSSQEQFQQIREIRKIIVYIHKFAWPLRDVTSWMGKDSTNLIQPTTELYIRDVYDHVIQVIDTMETYRELLSGIADLYISNTSYKLNEVMKVLTIISTIFIPMSFIAGVYGMNFKYMPELNYRWGYGCTWIVMITIAVVMLYYFKRKKWF